MCNLIRFSPVNPFHVNLILRLARRILKGRGKLPSPQHSNLVSKIPEFCEPPLANKSNFRREWWEPLIYSQLVRDTGGDLDLPLGSNIRVGGRTVIGLSPQTVGSALTPCR